MYFLTSTCKPASSPHGAEPKFQELLKFEAGKQSSATLSQHIRLVSKRNAWRVARTTSGEPDLDNFTEMTFIEPAKTVTVYLSAELVASPKVIFVLQALH